MRFQEMFSPFLPNPLKLINSSCGYLIPSIHTLLQIKMVSYMFSTYLRVSVVPARGRPEGEGMARGQIIELGALSWVDM